MGQLKLSQKVEKKLNGFNRLIKEAYKEGLISVILYGSAASGEFVDTHSNLNVLLVLKNTDLENLKKAAFAVNKFPMINPLFLTESYILRSLDIFPIEFLDMQENYQVLYGQDILKDINIDTRNLRFQCEQELKVKLINLRQVFLMMYKDKAALCNLLFKSFTSVLHILRNVLRLKGKASPYNKEEILKALALEFQIDMNVWQKIWLAKNRQIKLNNKNAKELFIKFVRDLERIVDIVDRL